MPRETTSLILFTDLDGCLLNKSDYDFSAAVPTLQRLKDAAVPVVLCSSKTQAEMQVLAVALKLAPAPMTCENGGLIVWSPGDEPDTSDGWPEDNMVLGIPRDQILQILADLKSDFAFRSFADLGVPGVMAMTDLPQAQATAALARQCTEPLLWDDTPERVAVFRSALARHDLTLTQGGRFWHVAGSTTKGQAVTEVLQQFRRRQAGQTASIVSSAVGDSPIDQSMLDVVDYPVGIPWPAGEIKVRIDSEAGILATVPGAAGWAQAVGMLLDRLGIPG